MRMDDSLHRAPLAALNGAEPDAPAWFAQALADEPARELVEIDGARIEALSWGERGKPGLLFLHGNGAHADWWSFIAPFFARDHRVTAMSWSGMGGSDWREAYSLDQFVSEAFGVAEHTGLFESAVKPVFVGHSFGGFPVSACAAHYGGRLRAAIMVDTPVRTPEQEKRRREHGRPRTEPRPSRVYDSIADALARFRFAPTQPCENLFIADLIARRSLKPVPNGTGGEGWTWRFDPFLWAKFRIGEVAPLLASAKCPLAIIWGDRSKLMPAEVLDHIRSLVAANTPMIAIPDADHHVMVDQPLAFVAALRGLLAGWPTES